MFVMNYEFKGDIICPNHAIDIVGEVTEKYFNIFSIPQNKLPQLTEKVGKCVPCETDPIFISRA